MILLICLYQALGLLIISVEFHRIQTGRPADALTLFNAAYFVFFVFVPLNIFILGEEAVRQKYVYQTYSYGDLSTIIALIISYATFVGGYFYRGNTSAAVDAKLEWSVDPIAVNWVICIFFVIGGLSLTYHISLTGGIIEALKVSFDVRTGNFPLEGNYLFVRQFSAFLSAAFMLSWARGIDANRKKKFSMMSYFFLGLLGIVFVYYALTTFGRREFLIPIAICILIWTLAGQRREWNIAVLLAALYIIWFYFYSIFIPPATPTAPVLIPAVAVTEQATEFAWGAYVRTIQGLADSFMHFVAAQHATLWQFGFLADIWEIPSQLVPSQVLGFERPRGMFGETTKFILDKPLEQGKSGEEPLGLHGYLLVNFSYFGMFLIFYLMGIGYRLLDATLRPTRNSSALSWLVFFWATCGALEFLRDGALILIIKPRLSWWLAIGILYYFLHRNTPLSFSQKIKGD